LLEDENQLSIFPNPSNGIFSINQQANFNKPQTIEIYNMLGENIYTSSTNKTKINNINMSDSPKGLYFVKLIDGEKTSTQKIIIQ
jgi:hypothetical protein